MSTEFWVFRLKVKQQVENWNKAPWPAMEEQEVVLNEVVLDDCADNLCIGATGNDGKYYQYDSYEGYYADGFFAKDFDKHGLYIESFKVKIPNIEQFKV